MAALGRLFEELAGERRDVLAALAERGQVDLDHGQTVVEVFAKRAFVDHLAEVAVGGGDDAHVDRDHLRPADALNLARLEHAQKLRLKADVELADFVEEQGAAVGHFEAAALAVGGAGERAALVAEQNALDEVGWNRAAILNDERALCALRSAVNRTGDELFAGAGFAPDQDGQVACGHLLEDSENLAHADAAANELVELFAPAQVDFDGARAMLEADDGAPDAQGHARLEPGLAHADPCNPGPVGRAEVAQQKAVLLGDDFAVRAAHGGVVERQVADDALADGHALAGNVEPLAFFGPVFDDQSALAKLPLGDFAVDQLLGERGVVVHSPSFRSAWMAAA